jgi:hypothetical protein
VAEDVQHGSPTSRDHRTEEPLSRLELGDSQGETKDRIASTPPTEDVEDQPAATGTTADQDAVEDAGQGRAVEDAEHNINRRTGRIFPHRGNYLLILLLLLLLFHRAQ